ncbi:MAG: FtsX-like permease family protein [Treponema sp.]|nr:FtsX-like permease family protein [Treponema sp.]
MGTLWKIALRNTLRHRRRTIITAIVMTAGISVFIVFDSMLAGLDRMAVDNMTDYTLSSLKVRTPQYVADIAATPLDKSLPDAAKILAVLGRRGIAAAPRIRFVARVSNYNDEIPVIADGVDPTADRRVFKLASAIVSGTWLPPEEKKSVVMGARLAQELGLKVGDSLLVIAQTVDDVTNADEYSVVGLLDTPAPEVNESGLYMSLADARALLVAPSAPGGYATEVDAALPRAATLDAAIAKGEKTAAALRPELPGLRVDSIAYLARDYLAVRDAKATYSFVLIFVVLVIAAVGIVNTILMSVYSRIREIGVLRAYGMTRREISTLFTLEGLALGAIGSILGVALGALLDLALIVKGVSLAGFGSAAGSLPLSGVLRGEWNPRTMLTGFLFGLVVALVAARIPARQAAKLEPTSALRFQ